MLSLSSLKINLYNALMSGASNAAMSLDFLSGTLDPRITFSRGSNATLVDAAGKIVYAPANLLTYSEQFDNAAWGKVNATITANTVAAPDGTTTADRLVNTGLWGLDQSATLVAGIRYVISVWVKSGGTGKDTFILYGDGTQASGTLTATSSWVRVEHSFVATVSGARGNGIFRDSSNNSVDIYLWGAQLEPVTYQTTPSTYVATTASAYYGPRFDYDPVTLAPKGLLIEEARTNLLTYSGAVGGTNWFTSQATPTLNSIMAPDGTTTATLVTESTSTSAHAIFGTNMTLAVAANTVSMFIKAGTRRYVSIRGETTAASTYAWITFDTTTGAINANAAVTSSSATVFGNGWWRVTMTWANTNAGGSGNIVLAGSDVSTAPIVGSVLGNSYVGTSSTFYVWGGQVEAGSFATSYIPTVASTVTRSADVATMTGTNFSSWYNPVQGTFVVDFTPDEGLVNNATRVLSTTSGGVSNRVVDIGILGANWVNYNGTNSTAIGAASVTSVPQRIAAAYATANYGYVLNGGTVATDSSALVNSPTQLSLGQLSFTSYLNGHIRSIAYYNTRLPNAQLQVLST